MQDLNKKGEKMKLRYWKRRRQLLLWMGTAAILLTLILFIIIMALQKQAEENKVIPEPTEQLEMPLREEKEDVEKPEEDSKKLQEESDVIQIHLDGYMKTIFNGWDWVLQEKLTEYGKEHQIPAKNAVVLAYIGYDIQSDTYSFYLQLDDEERTILLGKYHPYQAEIEPTDKTLEDIQKEKGLLGDQGEPEEQLQESETVSVSTPEPTKAPVVPYADMEILEVPVELAELLGENAPSLPEGLAIYLASEGRKGDTYAVYSGNLKVEDGKAQFDLKLKDETVIHVDYDGAYRYSFE